MRLTQRLLVTAACAWAVTGPSAWADHSTNRRDCSDFLTQAGAQEYFAQHPGDPDRLDVDNDGTACEELPAGIAGGRTTTTTVAASGGAAATAQAGTTTTVDSRLVRTGSDEGPALAMAALLIGAGGAFVAIGRHRRPAQ